MTLDVDALLDGAYEPAFDAEKAVDPLMDAMDRRHCEAQPDETDTLQDAAATIE